MLVVTCKKILEANGGQKEVTGGFISLQAESHPTEFRNLEILPLDPETGKPLEQDEDQSDK